jgi:6-pyruvoyltetrahydropterin/6-carboxytetrahydropterin synthase
VPTYRLCKTFTVESGHLLSKHPERCRFPHGHTRTIEVVVSGDTLDEGGMLVDFKALKLALQGFLDRFDHATAINSEDPLLPTLREMYPPEAIVVFEGTEPTTEAIARQIYEAACRVVREGFCEKTPSGAVYSIEPGRVRVDRVRVWETPSSWAEYG